jgi:sugar-specific transcriptional regulator TrmB
MSFDSKTLEKYHQLLGVFGLTQNDTAVYAHLIKLGDSAAVGKISLGTALHRQYVYNSIEKLQKLKLIEELKDGKRFKYRALPLYQIEKIAKDYMEKSKEAIRELSLVSAVKDQQDIEYHLGERKVMDFEENLIENLPENEVQYIIGGASEEFIRFFGKRYFEMAKVAKKKGLRSYFIGCEQEREWLCRAQQENPLFEFRILKNFPKTLVETVVRLDSVTIYNFATPPLVYVIKSKVISQDYKKHFDMLWEMSSSSATKMP